MEFGIWLLVVKETQAFITCFKEEKKKHDRDEEGRNKVYEESQNKIHPQHTHDTILTIGSPPIQSSLSNFWIFTSFCSSTNRLQ